MKLSESISRLRFTISNGNKPGEKDIDALNKILEHLQKTQEETIQDNLLFAKLYAYLMGKLVSYYTNADEASKHIHKILSQKMPTLIGILQIELQSMELRQVLPDPILSELSPKKTREKLAKYPNIEADFLAAWDYWDYDNTASNLQTSVNLAIHEYKNHI